MNVSRHYNMSKYIYFSDKFYRTDGIDMFKSKKSLVPKLGCL
jgi:hypothetical protein